jgi:hypothetical protein
MRLYARLLAASITLSIGCSDAPSRLQQSSFDAGSVATAAVRAHDKNGDGSLNDEELIAIPSIQADLSQFDLDNNKSVSQSEITERIQKWQALKVAIVPCSFVVKLDGKPLSDAEVSLEPEDFLGSTLKRCSGKTDSTGRVSPSQIATAEDDDTAGLTGVPPGLYKIRITHPKLEKLPQYNTATTLGLQVAPDNPNLMLLEFVLSSK